MDSKVDKLFKEKLEDHTLQPSSRAWEKVDSHLSKKNKMVLWARIAAAIALLGVLTFVALNLDLGKAKKLEMVREQPPATKPEQPAPIPNESIPDETKQVAEAPVRKKPELKKVAPAVPQHQPKVAVAEQPAAPMEETLAEIKPAEISTEEKSITLVYSLPTIKKEQPKEGADPAVAQVDEPKKTGLERVLEIAKEVKNADNPLAELRQAKDDILAFEFKKDKDKNKKQN